MKPRLAMLLALALAVSACGIKSDLERPSGTKQDTGERDPSKPSKPINR